MGERKTNSEVPAYLIEFIQNFHCSDAEIKLLANWWLQTEIRRIKVHTLLAGDKEK